MAGVTEQRVTWHADRPPVTVRLHAADGTRAATPTLLLAHGAGAGLSHPFMVTVAELLSSRGLDVLTFNFPYMDAGRRLPDPSSTLESCYLAVVGFARRSRRLDDRPVFLGGKSLGGRIASHVAAFHGGAAGPLGGLVFFGYPLHPPGRPERRRDGHLGAIRAPMLFVQGTRDAFGTPEEIQPVVAGLGAPAEVMVVEQGDHSFAVPRRVGITRDAVLTQICDGVAEWISRRSF